MKKPATAQQLIDQIERWEKQPIVNRQAGYSFSEEIIFACKAFLEALKALEEQP